jgi:hypothetical protein
VGPAAFKAVARRAERLGCVRFAYISAIFSSLSPTRHPLFETPRKEDLSVSRKPFLIEQTLPKESHQYGVPHKSSPPDKAGGKHFTEPLRSTCLPNRGPNHLNRRR